MLKVGPTISPVVAAIIISLAVGGVGGYYVRFFYYESSLRPASAPPVGGMGGMGMGGGMGGMGGGMGMGGGQAEDSGALVRLVRNLSLIQKVQGKGLNSQQAQGLAPILKELKSAEKLSDKDCETKLAAINKVLTDDQKKTLEDLQPQRSGGMGGGMGRMGGGPSGPPGFAGASGGGAPPMPVPVAAGGGGSGADPERPFASERNRQSLEELMTLVEEQSRKK